MTDENGRFTIPVEDFEGTTEAVIQTRKVGKERNKDASILIDRNFPPLRGHGYKELHQNGKTWPTGNKKPRILILYTWILSGKVEGLYVLDEVEITKANAGKEVIWLLKSMRKALTLITTYAAL